MKGKCPACGIPLRVCSYCTWEERRAAYAAERERQDDEKRRRLTERFKRAFQRGMLDG